MSNAPEINYADNIYVGDWSLRVLNDWLARLTYNGDFIREDICEALDTNFNVGQMLTINNFREYLCLRRFCGGTMCRNRCQWPDLCSTAKNIKLLLEQADLDHLFNFNAYKMDVLQHFFFKLNDYFCRAGNRKRISVLVLYFDHEEKKGFIEKQRCLIVNQLSSQFYLTDYTLLDVETQLFSHIKGFIDCVVVTIDSNYQTNQSLDEYYTVLNRFTLLKIFIVPTEDVFFQTNGNFEIVKDHFRILFPKNKIYVIDWFADPGGLPTQICDKVTAATRLQIAFSSFFIRNTGNIIVAQAE